MKTHDLDSFTHVGPLLAEAQVVLILVHGRGGSAADLLGLVPYLPTTGVAVRAPEATGNSWYPQRFLAPLAQNEPWLSSALAVVDHHVNAALAAGVPAARLVLAGFSQGACLAAEYAARHPRRYGAVAALSGALIGPPDSPTPYQGDLAGAPVLLACAEADAHIPWARVAASATVLRALGADVTLQQFPGTAHTVFPDELKWLREHWPQT